MRAGLLFWLRRPAGMLVLALLLLALVAGNAVRAQVHAHAHGDAPHAFQVQDLGILASGHDHHDHWLGHDSGGDHGSGQPDDEPQVHIHTATPTATMISAVTGIPVAVFTALPVAEDATGAPLPPSPPSEPFRPPIA